MARVGNTVNLERNSRYDILVYDYPDGYPSGQISLGFGKTPKRISGIEKVSQTFIRCLLTNIGSDVVRPTRGSAFTGFSGGYNLQATNPQEINAEITNAVQDAAEQTRSILNATQEGQTSQLDYVQVIRIEQNLDSTTLRLRLVTLAGESAPIALPFTSLGLEINE